MTLSTTARRLVLSLVLLAPVSAMAADEHYLADGVAIGGYDAVAYHTAGMPTKGDAMFTATYQGAAWNFASAENRDMFIADPAKYAPAYGGWCSAGASKGKKVPTRPEFFAIVDGQLYLNSSEAAHFNLFLKDTAGTISKGEGNWKRIFATEADRL
ncbi:MAG: YHS domain-containing protein [Paracoccaceae bacterium]|nr:MAG: YHS domain-containing protein [Paracoccaceae bacterium]